MKRKIAAIATAAPLALMLTAGTALATSYAAPAEPGAPGQDQYRGGGDLACVTLLGPSASPDELQARAQNVLAEDPSDPNGLDADGDGVACEFTMTPTGELAFEDGSGSVADSATMAGPASEGPGVGADLACVTVLGPEAGPEDLQQEAQAIYDADPADPHDLDADGSGLACEFSQDATGEVAFEDGSGYVTDSASPTPTEQQQDISCVGLLETEADPEQEAASPACVQEQAQAILEEDPADPNGLDANRNGTACEFTESSTGEVAFEDGTRFAEVVDFAAPPVPQTSTPGAEAASVVPPSTADGPAFQPTEAPRESSSPAPTMSKIRKLPATGGPVSPALPAAPVTGTALVGTALLALAARRRPPGV